MIARLLAFLVVGLSLSVVAALSHAETMADKVFGPWERVSVAQILKPVPVLRREDTPLGSVGKVRKSEIIGCPIYEQSEVIGWSMNCRFPSVERGGIRDRP